jgi:hypothetical protein
MGKNIQIGIGISKNDNSMIAAREAAQMAIQECGKMPTFSIAYVDSKYDPSEVLAGLNEILGDKWIGASTDSQFTSKEGYNDKSIAVLAISSDYLRFSTGVFDNYRADPLKAGEEAIKNAMSNIKIDSYIDPYIQFRRTQTKSFNDIVRTPPYFILTLICGAKYQDGKPIPGKETEFLEGIYNVTGPNIPIIGASASTNFEEYQRNISNGFVFAQGKLYYDAGVTVFVVSNLYFAYTLVHGYARSSKVALITKLDQSGHNIEEIDGKPAVEQYSALLGVSKEEFLKNPYAYTLPRPLGLIDPTGSLFIKEAVPNPDGMTMYCLCKLAEDSAVNIVDFDKEKTVNAISQAIQDADLNKEQADQKAIGLCFSCCGRKAMLGKEVDSEIAAVKSKFPNLPFFGFHSFGEIGAKPNKPSQTVNQSVSVLLIFDRLLTE